MKPVDQRYYRGQLRPMGDCVAACVASIFELSLDEVPNFMEVSYQRRARHDWAKEWDQTWWGMLNSWAWSFGVGCNRIQYQVEGRLVTSLQPLHYHPGFWIGSVESRDPAVAAQGNSSHAVVVKDNEIVHDPNPDSRAIRLPYRFSGETWFEMAHPELWIEKLDWREIFSMDRVG